MRAKSNNDKCLVKCLSLETHPLQHYSPIRRLQCCRWSIWTCMKRHRLPDRTRSTYSDQSTNSTPINWPLHHSLHFTRWLTSRWTPVYLTLSPPNAHYRHSPPVFSQTVHSPPPLHHHLHQPSARPPHHRPLRELLIIYKTFWIVRRPHSTAAESNQAFNQLAGALPRFSLGAAAVAAQGMYFTGATNGLSHKLASLSDLSGRHFILAQCCSEPGTLEGKVSRCRYDTITPKPYIT